MSSKASQMHFALILVKGAEEAWGIGSFQDGVIHVVIEEQWKSASQGRYGAPCVKILFSDNFALFCVI